MKRLVLGLALLLALAPLAARAQGSLYRFELTPTVSYRFGGTIDGRDNALTRADLKVDDSAAYGATFDIPLSSNIQLELLASRQESQLRFDRGLFGGTADVADVDVSYYHAGILWQWGDRRVSPYIVASLGVVNLDPSVPGASSENRFSASFGGGVKVFVSDAVGFRFEGRGFVSDINGGRRDSCSYHDNYCYGNEFSQGQASVGLILAW